MAIKVYRQGALNDVNSMEQGEKALKQDCKQIYEQMKVTNDEKCALACRQFLNQYHSEIIASLS